ncbi:unnamed protein product [Aspergillus oryzae]|uniref:Unnamed protein product n=1 Tax=Aspergillus oryzae var. brunneus TaxID=332754 RepID=A0ABQ6LHR4_ASPOZ|nr:unnamed protein product [Aspergillus oryzae]GMF95908.1 unnamed protein product [Aspergillus oryzae]GMG13874.1 unnamed protein product [Aspergillus oryzae]GMG54462.1 unnamed protein product [Aspergillus oryzae var. brunneus]
MFKRGRSLNAAFPSTSGMEIVTRLSIDPVLTGVNWKNENNCSPHGLQGGVESIRFITFLLMRQRNQLLLHLRSITDRNDVARASIHVVVQDTCNHSADSGKYPSSNAGDVLVLFNEKV